MTKCLDCKIFWLEGYSETARKILCESCKNCANFEDIGNPTDLETAIELLFDSPKITIVNPCAECKNFEYCNLANESESCMIPPCLIVRKRKRTIVEIESKLPIY